jgi:hypothetical protein
MFKSTARYVLTIDLSNGTVLLPGRSNFAGRFLVPLTTNQFCLLKLVS